MKLVVGCDLGKRVDHSALVIVERQRPRDVSGTPVEQWNGP